MKKIFTYIIIVTFVLTGCELSNNPNSKVEELLGNYQRLDDNVVISYTSLTPSSNLSDDIEERYREVIKEQYKNLTYELKDEKVDGNKAVITVEIEVTNFRKILDKYDYTSYSDVEYNNKVLDELEKAKDRVQYTIEFSLTKDNNEEWSVDSLDNDITEKLLGIY